jgi:Metallo-beta-lactamase superfamily
MLSIEMLPAARGDCLWIEYGSGDDVHRVLIDGGIASTQHHIRKRIEELQPDKRRFDLLVITHIDLDHIAGVLGLLRDPPEGLRFADVWFNGWEQLLAAEKTQDDGILGAKLGERVSARLKQRGFPWNSLFEGGPVAIPAGVETIPRKSLEGGMTLTLLSPTVERLRGLLPVWEAEVKKAELDPGKAGEELEGIGHPEDVADEGILGDEILDVDKLAASPFKNDTSRANGSSIAMLAEFGDASCVLMGDAYASDVERAVRSVLAARGGDRLKIDALKLSHHGGRKNTSVALLELLDCPRYLFSTDGSFYDHPHPESVARVIVHGAKGRVPSLFFNYRSPETSRWDTSTLLAGHHPYEPLYPAPAPGLRIEL